MSCLSLATSSAVRSTRLRMMQPHAGNPEGMHFPLRKGTEVLVASVRHPIHVVEAARLGADVCTCPTKVIDALFNHPLTDIGLERFLADWKKAQGR